MFNDCHYIIIEKELLLWDWKLITCACCVQYKHCEVICVALRVKIAAMCQSFKVKESVLLQQKVLYCIFK